MQRTRLTVLAVLLCPLSLSALRCYQTTAVSLTDKEFQVWSIQNGNITEHKYIFMDGKCILLILMNGKLHFFHQKKNHSGCLTIPTGQTSCFCGTDGWAVRYTYNIYIFQM